MGTIVPRVATKEKKHGSSIAETRERPFDRVADLDKERQVP
jgi:hypothetical protein